MDETDLIRVARKAARFPEAPKYAAMIQEAKRRVAAAKQSQIDHDAEHAGQAVA